jgi:hypothetical protein
MRGEYSVAVNVRLKDYVLTNDTHGWAVYKVLISKSGKNEGEEYLTYGTFYPKISQAVDGMVDRMLRDTPDEEVTTLKELKEAVNSLRAFIREQLP